LSVFVLDADNSIIKGKIVLREQGEFAFPIALICLTERKYHKTLSRAKPRCNIQKRIGRKENFPNKMTLPIY